VSDDRPPHKGPKAQKKAAAKKRPAKKKAPGKKRPSRSKESADRRPGSIAPEPTAARGIALVVLAIAIGFFLLAQGLDSEGSIVDTDTGDAVKEERSPDTTLETVPDDGSPATSVLTPTTRPAAEVSVLVANGSGVAGAAGRVTEQLQQFGFVMIEAANAPKTSVTVVYYVEGFQAEGESIAGKLGVDATSVQPMPEPVPPIDGVGEAKVLVQLGPDVAPAG